MNTEIQNPIEGLSPLSLDPHAEPMSWQALMEQIYGQLLKQMDAEQGPPKSWQDGLQRKTQARDAARELAMASGLPSELIPEMEAESGGALQS